MTTSSQASSKKSPYCVNLKDITGQKFGRLTVLRREGKNISWQATWRCLCECGKETVQAGSTLRAGIVVSCGCYHAEVTKKLFTKHGLSRLGYYASHKQMIRRCYNTGHIDWKNYGARGIKVCERWRTFENFAADMAPTWSKGLTIERRDVNGDYTPENTYWTTMLVQNNNKRNNVRIIHDGRDQTSAEWAREAKISLPLFRSRRKWGWSMEEILSIRPGDRKRATPTVTAP